MRYKPATCPECRKEGKRRFAYGTVDKVIAVALMTRLPDGRYEHDGESKVDWDSQVTVTTKSGRHLLTCYAGHEWPAKFLEA